MYSAQSVKVGLVARSFWKVTKAHENAQLLKKNASIKHCCSLISKTALFNSFFGASLFNEASTSLTFSNVRRVQWGSRILLFEYFPDFFLFSSLYKINNC